VIIPSTEFGARWFEAVRAEDAQLDAAVHDDPELFERESDHLDVVLTHLLFEERFVGTGSWPAMTEPEPTVTFDSHDADALWHAWALADGDDILARAAFERMLRHTAGLEDEGLYFRPGGWSVDLPATAARGHRGDDPRRRLSDRRTRGSRPRGDHRCRWPGGVDGRATRPPGSPGAPARRPPARRGLEETPISAARAHRELPKARRREVSRDDIADALDRLGEAGLAHRDGDDAWVLRAKGSEAWIRLSLRVERD